MRIERSVKAFDEAKKLIPGGVNSPVRAFRAVGGQPLFISRGLGSRIWDVDQQSYIDYVGSWGPLILGHAHPQVISAIEDVAQRGTSYGAPTELETMLAATVVGALPSVEMVRFVNSGTEAAMSALRLARAYTKRDKILKFEGCYHGHSDMLLAAAGSGVLTLGVPESVGVPADAVKDTLTAPYNDLAAVERVLEASRGQVAAVIVEPVAGNMGVVPPQTDFLPGLRDLATRHGALLVFDEVITGFRVSWGGAQKLYGVLPDLTCLGKIIGGGLPVGAYGGREEIMQLVSPSGPVYQAGTLSGNPLAMAAGFETLHLLADPDTYPELERKSAMLAEGLGKAAHAAGVPIYQTRVGSMQCVFFTDQTVTEYASAKTSDTMRFARYHRAMLERGVYLAPSQFEATFVSLAHSDKDIASTIQAAGEAFRAVIE